MDENYDDIEVNTDSDDVSNTDTDSGVTNEEILDRLNELIGDNEDENDTERDSLSDNEIDSEILDEDSSSLVDYSEALNSIYSRLDVLADTTRMENETLSQLAEDYSTYVEYQTQSILDKPINDYTVGESLGLVIVTVVVLKTLMEMLERLWLKWHF